MEDGPEASRATSHSATPPQNWGKLTLFAPPAAPPNRPHPADLPLAPLNSWTSHPSPIPFWPILSCYVGAHERGSGQSERGQSSETASGWSAGGARGRQAAVACAELGGGWRQNSGRRAGGARGQRPAPQLGRFGVPIWELPVSPYLGMEFRELLAQPDASKLVPLSFQVL
jgi:hypothetical protein